MKNALYSVMASAMGAVSSFAQAFSNLSRYQKPDNQPYRHGSSKSSGGKVGKNGKTWSFVERCGPGIGRFKCRQNGEIRLFKIKPVGDRRFNDKAAKHYGLSV